MSDFYKTDLNFSITATGDLDKISGVENVKKRLMRRLETTKGTFINRPNYGVGIKNYINVINNITTKRKLFIDIVEQFEKEEAVSKVIGVSIQNSPTNSEAVTINVNVELVGKQNETFSFSFNKLEQL